MENGSLLSLAFRERAFQSCQVQSATLKSQLNSSSLQAQGLARACGDSEPGALGPLHPENSRSPGASQIWRRVPFGHPGGQPWMASSRMATFTRFWCVKGDGIGETHQVARRKWVKFTKLPYVSLNSHGGWYPADAFNRSLPSREACQPSQPSRLYRTYRTGLGPETNPIRS